MKRKDSGGEAPDPINSLRTRTVKAYIIMVVTYKTVYMYFRLSNTLGIEGDPREDNSAK